MKLYEHQQKIIDDDPKKCGFFLGTGSGKSLTALLLSRGRTLVIAPKTQVEDGNWTREADKNGLRTMTYWASLPGDVKPLNLTVISKETFRRDHESLGHFDTVIIDEAHTVLGVTPNYRYVKKQRVPKTSQLFEALESFLRASKPERLYLCTATIAKSPMTVWGAGRVLGKDWDFEKWRRTFYFQLDMPGRDVWVPKKDDASKTLLAKYVQGLGYVGRLSDYFDVPDQTYKTIHVELTAEQKKRLKELPMEFPDPIVLIGKKHQVENGSLKGNEFSTSEMFENEKIRKLLELSEEFPRMVIFVKYTAQIEQITNALVKAGKYVLALTGQTDKRGELIAKANSMEECIFIAQAQVSAGWELPDYPVMVFASMSYSVVDRIQGEGRILRANALKKNLYIDLVVKGGIDEAVYDCIINKKDFNERIYVDSTRK